MARYAHVDERSAVNDACALAWGLHRVFPKVQGIWRMLKHADLNSN